MSNEAVLIENSIAFEPFFLEKSDSEQLINLKKLQFLSDELLIEVSHLASYYKKDTSSIDNLLKLAEQNNVEAIYSIASIYLDTAHPLYNLEVAESWLIKAIQAEPSEKLSLYAKYFECFSEFTAEELIRALGVNTIKVDEWFILGNLQLNVWLDKQDLEFQEFKKKNSDAHVEDLDAFLKESQQKLSRIKAILPFFMQGVLAGDLKESLQFIKRIFEELTQSPEEKKLLFAEVFPKQNKFSQVVAEALLENFSSLLPDAVIVDIYSHYPDLARQYFQVSFIAEKFYQAIVFQFNQHQQIDESIRNWLDKAPENSMIVGIKTVIDQWNKKIHQAYNALTDGLRDFKNPGWIERIFRWFESSETQMASDREIKLLESLDFFSQDSNPQQQYSKLQKAIEDVLQRTDISFRLSWRLNNLLFDLKKKNHLLPNLSDIFILPKRNEKQVSEINIHPMQNTKIWLPIFSKESKSGDVRPPKDSVFESPMRLIL